MAHDLMSGRKLELDALNGAIVRMGKQFGISTPMNRAIYAALIPYLLHQQVNVSERKDTNLMEVIKKICVTQEKQQ